MQHVIKSVGWVYQVPESNKRKPKGEIFKLCTTVRLDLWNHKLLVMLKSTRIPSSEEDSSCIVLHITAMGPRLLHGYCILYHSPGYKLHVTVFSTGRRCRRVFGQCQDIGRWKTVWLLCDGWYRWRIPSKNWWNFTRYQHICFGSGCGGFQGVIPL